MLCLFINELTLGDAINRYLVYSVFTSNTRYFIRRKAKQINTGNSDAKPSPGNTLRKNKQTIICLNAGKVGPVKRLFLISGFV